MLISQEYWSVKVVQKTDMTRLPQEIVEDVLYFIVSNMELSAIWEAKKEITVI